MSKLGTGSQTEIFLKYVETTRFFALDPALIFSDTNNSNFKIKCSIEELFNAITNTEVISENAKQRIAIQREHFLLRKRKRTLQECKKLWLNSENAQKKTVLTRDYILLLENDL